MGENLAFLDQFNYALTGPKSGPRLVFLHGLMGSQANWRRIIAKLEDEYHILAFDQRGHGRSFHPETGYRSEDYAQDLKLILDELGWADCCLVGHSMGGRNAMVFAAKLAHRVTKLVIEDIGPIRAEAGTSRIRRWIQAVPVPFASRKDARAYFDGDFLRNFAADGVNKQLADFFYMNMTEATTGEVNWRPSLSGLYATLDATRDRDEWWAWEALSMPILLVRGEHSEDLPRSLFEQMLGRNRMAQGVEIAGAGHWVHFDQPDAFLFSLRTFLQL